MRTALADGCCGRSALDSLLPGFALTALLLAAIGINGVMSLSVNARVREFGVRLALGADLRVLLGTVLRRGVVLQGSGSGSDWSAPTGPYRAISTRIPRHFP